MFKRKAQPTFDDVASDEAKRARAEINGVARDRLLQAAHHAALGDTETARHCQEDAANLRALAISIPLDMIAAGL